MVFQVASNSGWLWDLGHFILFSGVSGPARFKHVLIGTRESFEPSAE